MSSLGISKEKIIETSIKRNEPKWLLEFRLDSYDKFLKLEKPKFGPDLSGIDLSDINFYKKDFNKTTDNWDEVDNNLRKTFDDLGVIDAEKTVLDGLATQYESENLYHNLSANLKEKGVIFEDLTKAFNKYPEITRKYFSKLVKNDDNLYAALNSAVFSGGSFIYIPEGVVLDKPLHSYFRINSEKLGQFERTLIVVDKFASINYIEGCTAKNYQSSALHAAVVEIYVLEGAKCRYTAIQNWSDNVYNLVTKRALCKTDALMEWVDGNIGSKVNMKYPAIILEGDNSVGNTISVALANNNQIQDSGARMIHIGKNTKSKVISKSISMNGGENIYRGKILHTKNAVGSSSRVDCDTLILDSKSISNTIPTNVSLNGDSVIEHEAKVSKISEDILYYLESRGIKESDAMELIVMGFASEFTKELPLEYAADLNKLLMHEMEGSVG